MRAFAVLSGLGEEHVVGHGDLIGRTPTAAVVIDDPRVSEAHAIISLRKGELYVLALRRMVIANSKPVEEALLVPGLTLTIVDEIMLTVERVEAPRMVLALTLPSGETQLLPQVASITTNPPRLHGRLIPDARAVVWSTGEVWRARHGDRTMEVHAGDELAVDGQRFLFTMLPIGQASAESTEGSDVAAPLRLVAFYDSIQLYQRNRKVHTLGGTGARILSELVACGGPTRWEIVAREIWPDEIDLAPLRHRWDVALGRLRARLRGAGVRDLIHSDGSGQLALELYDGDVVEDKT
jgi:hypothetical protein